MAQTGMDLRHVRVTPGSPTLSSFCFVYPDGSGGNLTTADSASDRVDPALVRRAEPELRASGERAIALAAPETPLAARAELLTLATRCGALRVGAFTTAEIGPAQASGLLHQLDLLALNRDEAAMLAGLPPDDSPAEIAEAAVRVARRSRPEMWISVTAGANGSWVSNDLGLQHLPALPVTVVSTAGAGDAHLAGLLSGLAAGLSLADAHALAALVAALSVTSPHTIHGELDADSLRAFALESRAPLPTPVRRLLRL